MRKSLNKYGGNYNYLAQLQNQYNVEQGSKHDNYTITAKTNINVFAVMVLIHLTCF